MFKTEQFLGKNVKTENSNILYNLSICNREKVRNFECECGTIMYRWSSHTDFQF